MNILIDTIEKYSGGYITYLKGLLSKSYILEGVTILIRKNKIVSIIWRFSKKLLLVP